MFLMKYSLPLTSIKGFARALQDDNLSEEKESIILPLLKLKQRDYLN